MRRTTIWLAVGCCALVSLAAGVAVADTGMWIHVRVDEGDGGAKVRVNLPLALVEKAWPLVPGHSGHGAFEPWREANLDLEQMREIWAEISGSPDMTFVTVEEDDETVRVWKQDGYLNVEVRADGAEQVDVRMPMQAVDALLAAEAPDMDSFVRALAAHGGGDLVTVLDHRSGDRVRVWVDDAPEAE